MSLWVSHHPFWGWQVDFGMSSLKYSYTLHGKFGVSKPVIIIDTCVVISWFTITNLESVSLKRSKRIAFCIIFCIWMTKVTAYIFVHWSNITCLMQAENTHRDTYWKLKILSQTVRILVYDWDNIPQNWLLWAVMPALNTSTCTIIVWLANKTIV